jgi:hypothetical protein
MEDLRSAFDREPVRTISRKPNNARNNFTNLGVLYVFDQGAPAP